MKTLDIQTWINEFNSEEINIDEIKKYLEFIEKATKEYNGTRYSEKHHILPRCLDKDCKYREETVRINGADHLRAHMKLTKGFRGYKKHLVGSAVAIMCKSKIKENLTPEEYEEARKVFSESQLGELNHNYGKPNYSRETFWITNGNCNKRVSCKDQIPVGWYIGVTKVSSNNGRIGITNGKENTYVESEDLILDGWQKGSTQDKPDVFGKNNPMFGKIWITSGVSNKLILKDEEIPNGWKRGALQNNPDQHGANSAIYGKISITNGKENKLVYPTDKIPNGWYRGQTQDHSKYGCNFNEGKIYINNGIKNKMIKKDEEIPEGWRRGMLRYKKEGESFNG